MNEIIRQKIAAYVKLYGTEEIKSTSEINTITTVPIQPSDFCYNRTNRGLFNGSDNFPKLFIYLRRNTYQIVGENYPYEGEVFWQPRGERERVVGSYTDGHYTPLNAKKI